MTQRLYDRSSIQVITAGACTPLGLDLSSTRVEIALGSACFTETTWVDLAGQPVRASRHPLIPDSASRTGRMLALSLTAIVRPLIVLNELGIQRIPLLLALPEREVGAYDAARLLNELTAASKRVTLMTSLGDTFPLGRAGFFAALTVAKERLHTVPAILVGAVDSLCDPASLSRLAGKNRVLSATNIDGLLPGEGAAFLVLSSADTHRDRERRMARLVTCVQGMESLPFAQGQPSHGNGLSAVLRQLWNTPELDRRRADRLLSCQSSEGFWTEELVKAYLRNAALFPEPFRAELLSANLGDTGAAAAALHMAMAADTPVTSDAVERPTRVLIYGCSDGGQIGACLLDIPADGNDVQTEQSTMEPLGLLTMHSEITALERQHCHEHLDELGFLIGQRDYLFHAPDGLWPDVHSVEQRILKRLDAIRIRPGLARQLAIENLDADDEVVQQGAVYCAAALANDPTARTLLCSRYESAESEKRPYWNRALKLVPQLPITDSLESLLLASRIEVQLSVLDLLSFRRQANPKWLLTIVESPTWQKVLRESAAVALSRIGHTDARGAVERVLYEMPQSLPLWTAALRLGSYRALRDLRQRMRTGGMTPPGLVRLLALAGDEADAGFFCELAKADSLSDELILACGIFGAPETVPCLIRSLLQPRGGDTHPAAGALERITGAGLRETAWLKGEAPDEDGQRVTRVSANPEQWTQWWQTSGAALLSFPRCCGGRAASLSASMDILEDARSRWEEREWAMDELLIQSRGFPGLELDWPVALQQRTLKQWRAQWGGRTKR